MCVCVCVCACVYVCACVCVCVFVCVRASVELIEVPELGGDLVFRVAHVQDQRLQQNTNSMHTSSMSVRACIRRACLTQTVCIRRASASASVEHARLPTFTTSVTIFYLSTSNQAGQRCAVMCCFRQNTAYVATSTQTY